MASRAYCDRFERRPLGAVSGLRDAGRNEGSAQQGHRGEEGRRSNLITRREEVAAMRSQANTARVFETSPMLMRLKEIEALEKVAAKANVQVVLGEKGLADRVMKLI
jgi:hypothetical protein